MCGIAGWFITKPQRVRPNALLLLAKNLMLGIESRGRDAAGYAYISRRDKLAHVAKAPVAASDFLDIDGHLLARNTVKAMPRELLIHTRYATQGEPSNNENNHPLYSKATGLCMIHNGWLVNDDELISEYSLKKDAEVDSETYLRLIEKFYTQSEVKTVETGIQEATKVVWGNIVCAMIQGSKPGVMWLWRDAGDLCLVHTDWGYVFASTPSAVLYALHYSLRSIDLGWYEIMNIPKAHMVKFTQTEQPKITELEPVNWNTAGQYKSRVFITEYNGTTKVRRNRSGYQAQDNFNYMDGYAGRYEKGHYDEVAKRWVWDDETSSAAVINNGVSTDTGKRGVHYLTRKDEGTTNSNPQAITNSQSKEDTTSKKSEAGTQDRARRPDGHAHTCWCEPCNKYWEQAISMFDME